MVYLANQDFDTPYDGQGNNCGDLANHIMDAGNVDHSGDDKKAGITTPNKQFDTVKGSSKNISH